jgi:ADP-ribose pyrophosphatase
MEMSTWAQGSNKFMQKKGPYKVLSSETKYKNPWIEIIEEKVIRPEGKEGIFGIIDYGRGTSTVALDSKKNIYLIREYYYALEEYGIQLPSGDIANGETPLQGAQRELLEEVGAASETWIDLGYINPMTMILRSPAYLFLARDIELKQDAEQGIERVVVPFDEAYQMVLDSKITHGPSCVAILKAKAYLKK